MSALAAVAERIAAEVDGAAATEPAPKAKAAPEPAEAPEATPADAERAKSEAAARAKGWKPKAEWDGDPEDWVSAKRFLREGESIEERQTLKKQLSRLTAQNKELADIVKANLTAQTQEKVQAKLAQRDAAIELGDKSRVRQLDQELAQVSKVPDPTPAEVTDWIAKHSEWWGLDPLATQSAVIYYGNLEAKNREDYAGNLEKTEKYIRKRFPDLFAEDHGKAAEAAQAMVQQTRKLSTVSVPTNGHGGPTKQNQWGDLPSEAKRVGEDLVRKGVMNREEYAKSYFDRNSA